MNSHQSRSFCNNELEKTMLLCSCVNGGLDNLHSVNPSRPHTALASSLSHPLSHTAHHSVSTHISMRPVRVSVVFIPHTMMAPSAYLLSPIEHTACDTAECGGPRCEPSEMGAASCQYLLWNVVVITASHTNTHFMLLMTRCRVPGQLHSAADCLRKDSSA